MGPLAQVIIGMIGAGILTGAIGLMAVSRILPAGDFRDSFGIALTVSGIAGGAMIIAATIVGG